MGDVAFAFVAAERLFGLRATWDAIDAAALTEDARLTLLEQVAQPFHSDHAFADVDRAEKRHVARHLTRACDSIRCRRR